MDYGSLYGMGSCYGEDYTASTLLQLGEAARNNIALAVNKKPFAELTPDQQAAAAAAMQRDLQGVDLTKSEVTLPQPVVAALVSVREAIAKGLSVSNPSIGWTRPDSLDPQLALKTADFIAIRFNDRLDRGVADRRRAFPGARHIGRSRGEGTALAGGSAVLDNAFCRRRAGSSALMVNAIDGGAAAFWRRRGFMRSRDDPLVLFRSIADISASSAAANG